LYLLQDKAISKQPMPMAPTKADVILKLLFIIERRAGNALND